MNENWYVLVVAALGKGVTTIEHAFELYETGKVLKRKKMSLEDIKDAMELKKEMTYNDLSKIYGKSGCTIYHSITKYKEGRYVR